MKTYQKPEGEILDIQAEQLMAISGDLELGDFELKNAEPTDATSGNLARELLFLED